MDDILRDELLEVLETSSDPLEWAEALGSLVMAGHRVAALRWLVAREREHEVARPLRAALEAADGSDLDEIVVSLTGDDLVDPEHIVDGLAVRDKWAAIRTACEIFNIVFNDEVESSISSFDDVLFGQHNIVARLAPSRRRARLAWVAFPYRSRLYWYNLV